MADKTTTSLTGATTPLDGTELFYTIQSGNSRKVAGSEIVKIGHTQAWSTITSTPTSLSGYGITDAATSAQGTKADSAVQPGDLATVATSGDYDDLSGKPTLGTAAATSASAYATAAQGSKADSALQSADIGTSVQAQGDTLDSLEGLSLVSGDILYATASDTLARLAKGTDGQVLNLASGVPAWASVAGTGDVTLTGTQTLTNKTLTAPVINNGTHKVGTTQTTASFAVRGTTGNQYEFGHTNTAGYGSTIGAQAGNGQPFIMFFGEAGTTNNTYRTRGYASIGLRGASSNSSLEFIKASSSSADNQTATVIATLDQSGVFNAVGGLKVNGTALATVATSGDYDDLTNKPISTYVATRTALKALDTSTITAAYLKEEGREGIFLFKAGDYSSRVTADTQEGIYVKATDTASSSGAWVRLVFDNVWWVRWFGIVAESSSGSAYDTEIAAMCALGELDQPRAYQFEGGIYNLEDAWPEANFQIGYWGTVTGASANTILNWKGIDATGRGVIHGSAWGYDARDIIIRSTEATASVFAGFSHITPNVARNGSLYLDRCSVSLGDKATHSFAFDGTANNGSAPIGNRDIYMSNCLIFGAADSCLYGASVEHLFLSNNNVSAVGGTGINALKIRGVTGAFSDVVSIGGGVLAGAIDLDKLTRGTIEAGVQLGTVKNTSDVSGVIIRGKSGAASGTILQHNWADDCYYDIDQNYLDRVAAYVGTAVADVTGDGTEYTVIFNTLGIETADYPMTKCYSTSTGKYTALVNGYHSVKARVSILGLLSGHTSAVLKIQSFTSGGSAISSGRRTLEINPYAISVSGRATLALAADILMNAGQYIQVTVQVSGSTKVVDIRGSATGDNWCSLEAQLS